MRSYEVRSEYILVFFNFFKILVVVFKELLSFFLLDFKRFIFVFWELRYFFLEVNFF